MKALEKKKLAKAKERKNKIIFISFFVLLIVVLLIFRTIRKQEINSNRGITTGRITSVQYVKLGDYTLNYSYDVGDKFFENKSSGTQVNKYNVKHFLWKEFPVIYSKRKPKVSAILILPEDFKMWDIAFPDSLEWVKQYGKW
jgi:hypothetical protein